MAVFNQLAQLAFAGDDVADVQAAKFVLARRRGGEQAAFGQSFEQPVVERALVFKLQRADAVGDLLQRVLDGVREGVHGVDGPLVAGVVVRGVADAVDGRVAQVDVGAGHVDFCAQDHSAIPMLALRHLAKTLEGFCGRAVTEGAVDAGRAEVAAVRAHLLRRLLVDVGVAGLDQIFGRAVHEVEVVAGEVFVRLLHARARRVVGKVVVPAEPAHGVADAVDVFLLFFFRVGVVKAQMAHAAVFLGQAEVEPDALGVADVQVAVGLGRKAHAHLGRIGCAGRVAGCVAGAAAPLAAGVGAFFEVLLDDVADEVAGLGAGVCGGGGGGRRGFGGG